VKLSCNHRRRSKVQEYVRGCSGITHEHHDWLKGGTLDIAEMAFRDGLGGKGIRDARDKH
jgi:hypothetical protein